MIETKDDGLTFSFPDVHPSASLHITFQRTLRIPDDDKTYPLPPGLGEFPLRHVDDFADAVPSTWLEHGGVMMPMHQAEAMWILLRPSYDEERGVEYPCAVKIATGKIDAVTGKSWTPGLHRGPQDYMVAPGQPWLDGYCVEKGTIRQFVAMPLGSGYSAEEQLTGKAEHGGVQIIVYPMKREVFERRFTLQAKKDRDSLREYISCALAAPKGMDMGLAPGGKMKQDIYEDPFDMNDWDQTRSSRCYVHIANSLVWRAITGQAPPVVPPTAADYTSYGLPWFDYYDEKLTPVQSAGILDKLKSVFKLGQERRQSPLPENQSVDPQKVVKLRPKRVGDQVREGSF